MANAVVPRLYHATAILLPDGRVLTAGTDGSWNPPPYSVGELRIELFSPPYLFAGARPTLAQAPQGVQYNQTFAIETPDAGQIDEVVIVRCSSVTHSFNFNQRLVELTQALHAELVRQHYRDEYEQQPAFRLRLR